jgi:hypothetical protein
MARLADPKSRSGLVFESREDLSPEFDFVRPEGVNWDFELPREVDFYVALTRHRTEMDFSYAQSYMQHADVLLVEGAGPSSYQQQLFEEISTGSDSALRFYINDVARGGFVTPNMRGFAVAKARALHTHRIPQAKLDPPDDHVLSVASAAIVKNEIVVADDRGFEALIALGRERDLWALKNLKKVVDGAVKHVKNRRRQVVITRGFAHLRLLRALEYQCECNPRKAHGSQVVASTVALPDGADDMQYILDHLN